LSSIHPIHENKINPKISTTEILRKRNAVGIQEEKSESNKNIQKITISKLDYKGQTKIRVHHPFLFGQIEKLRTIKGFTWTKTYSCWYMPYNKESFANLRYIQDMLGHPDIKTTLKYSHVSDNKRRTITSPLDKIAEKKKNEKNSKGEQKPP